MIVLIRHAQTSGGKGRCIGRTPLPLSDEGEAQALSLVEALADVPFARLGTSPSSRAVATLAPLAQRLGRTPDLLPGLDEINMGDWDGLPFTDIRSQFPDEFLTRGKGFASFRPRDGESFADLSERAVVALDELAKGPLPVLVVTHAGVIRSVLCRVTGHPLDDLFHFDPGNLESTVLRAGHSNGMTGLELVATGVRPGDLAPLLRP